MTIETMTDRQRALAVLKYESYDRLPVAHFGFWGLQKWVDEGHLTPEEAEGWKDGNSFDAAITEKLGFDFGYRGGMGFKKLLACSKELA